jgi:hypothetical protein
LSHCCFVYIGGKGNWGKPGHLGERIMKRNNKRLTLVLLSMALSFCVVSAVFAEGGKLQKRKAMTFTAAGAVAEVASEGLPFTMTLLIDKAYRIPKGQMGSPVQFAVSGNVKVKTEGTEAGSFDLSFDDIEPQDYVRVLGKKLANDKYLITHIVVHLEE